ncbi:beta-carotene 15,15'-monooxygenase [Streptococcus parasanguinis]|uniref:beta-carotene 15,15'-monooxygenase n=1 Tax=Streptococcus parasanguinis TaxID=1318 RepID=UPI00189A6992|nr:beta-carotene 15,15'-monooxygenase [Streptococcus parasanguinis]
MDFKMFEDRNWFQLIRNRVLRLSEGSIIKQDLLSTLLLINAFAYLIGIIKFMWNIGVDKIFRLTIPYILSLMFTINSFLDFILGKVDKLICWKPTDVPQFSFLDILSDAGFVLRVIPYMILLYLINFVLFSRERFINEVIKLILSILISIMTFGEYQFTLIVILMLLLVSSIQFGKGNLFRLFSICLLFLTPTLNLEKIEKSEQSISEIKIFLWIFSWLMISKIISIWFEIPLEVAVLLVIVLMVRFSLQLQTKNPRLEILLKGAIYFLVFLSVLISNNTTDEMISFATVSIAIYFAVDRFFSLFKDIETLVQNDEINYYLYFDNSIDVLKQKFLPDEFLSSVIKDIDDQELYGQLIIRAELGMKDSFEKILSLVKTQREYKSYEMLLLSLEYKLQKKDNKELTILKFFEDNLYNDIIYDEQMILPIEFLVLYGEELKENNYYEQARYYLSFSKYYDSYKYINSYFDCIRIIKDEKELNRLQKKYVLH